MTWLALVLLCFLVILVVFVNVPATRASAGVTMTKTAWQLESYADETGIMVPALTTPPVTIRFSPDGSLSGAGGCNNYTAFWRTKDLSINITTPVSETTLACPAPVVMKQESAYIAALADSAEIRLTETTLRVFSKSGKPLLVFVSRS